MLYYIYIYIHVDGFMHFRRVWCKKLKRALRLLIFSEEHFSTKWTGLARVDDSFWPLSWKHVRIVVSYLCRDATHGSSILESGIIGYWKQPVLCESGIIGYWKQPVLCSFTIWIMLSPYLNVFEFRWGRKSESYRVLQKKQPSTKKFQHAPEAPGPHPDPLYQCCYVSLRNGRSKNGCFFWKTPPCAAFTQHWDWGTRGVELSSLAFTLVGCFFWRTRTTFGEDFLDLWMFTC